MVLSSLNPKLVAHMSDDPTLDDGKEEETIDFSEIRVRLTPAITAMIDAIKEVVRNPNPENHANAYALWEQRHQIRSELQPILNLFWIHEGVGRCPFELYFVHGAASEVLEEYKTADSKRVYEKLWDLMVGAERKADALGAEIGLSFDATVTAITLMVDLEQQRRNPTAQQQLTVNSLLTQLLAFEEITELQAYASQGRSDGNITRLF